MNSFEFINRCFHLALDETVKSEVEYRTEILKIIAQGDVSRTKLRVLMAFVGIFTAMHILFFRSYWNARLAKSAPKLPYFKTLMKENPGYYFLQDRQLYYCVFVGAIFR